MGTPQFRKSSQYGNGMTGDIQLRHNFYISLRSITHQLFQFLLAIKSVVRPFIPSLRIPVCPDSRQCRIFPDLYTPALIVGQMQLQYIVFVADHLIDKKFHILYR